MQRGAAFKDDADRHVDEQLAQPALVGEGLHEGAVLELLQDARRDAAADIEPADRQAP
jgi:hypothetical protein